MKVVIPHPQEIERLRVRTDIAMERFKEVSEKKRIPFDLRLIRPVKNPDPK